MKKIIFVLIMVIEAYAANVAYAENLTKESFAEILSPIICNDGDAENIDIKDIENPSTAVLTAASAGIINLDNEGYFYPQEEVSQYDFLKSLIKTWEIRMGELRPAALGGYLEGYDALEEDEKTVIDKAVMLGIAPENGKFEKDKAIDSDTASVYVQRIIKSIEIMKNHGMQEVITSFRNEAGITGVPGGKITFYAALNETPEYNDAALIMALYCNDRLIDISHKSYTDLENYDFTIMHTSLEIPEVEGNMRVKVFIFDSLKSLKPIYEYKLIR